MSKDIRLSATRISSFLSCKQKYWFSYVVKLPKTSNPSFKLGLAVHESLELAGNIWKENEKFSKKDVDTILGKYNEVSVREGIEDYDSHTEGRELVKKRLSNFLTGRKILGLEIKFGFGGEDGGPDIVTDLGVPLVGSIDKVEEYDEDTLLIVDYKTSKTAPTSYQINNDVQLSLYDIVARKLFPKYKRTILSLDLLKSDMLYTYRTEEQRKDFEEYLKAVYDGMVSLDKNAVKASLNTFCPWCAYTDLCSAYQEACSKTDYKFLSATNYNNNELIDEWEKVKSVKKILEGRERELGMIMMEKIKRDSENIKTPDNEVYIRQNSKTEYDLETVANFVPTEDFQKLVTLNKKAVESYMEYNPAIKERVEESSVTNFTSPFLAIRKLKKK